MNVRQLQLELTGPVTEVTPRGLKLRPIRLLDDVPAYLALRSVAFADQTTPVRPWTEQDFARELSSQPWWRADRCWVVEPTAETRAQNNDAPAIVGSVTLAERRSESATRAAIHWLMVHPAWRRQGIARTLMTTALNAAWHDGVRRMYLESHAAWSGATRLYESIGFTSACGQSS